jgi:uncharacterized protein (DUF1499 family)
MVRNILVSVLSLAVLIVAFSLYRSMQSPADLWVATGIFPSCPSRPNCVSSLATDEVHRIAPLSYIGDARRARARLETVIRGMPHNSIQEATPEYLHVLFLTPLMRFHDDVELLVQPGGVIQVRSISRIGYRDWGVHRARVEALRDAFSNASLAPVR